MLDTKRELQLSSAGRINIDRSNSHREEVWSVKPGLKFALGDERKGAAAVRLHGLVMLSAPKMRARP